jgi:hypothetical protein
LLIAHWRVAPRHTTGRVDATPPGVWTPHHRACGRHTTGLWTPHHRVGMVSLPGGGTPHYRVGMVSLPGGERLTTGWGNASPPGGDGLTTGWGNASSYQEERSLRPFASYRLIAFSQRLPPLRTAASPAPQGRDYQCARPYGAHCTTRPPRRRRGARYVPVKDESKKSPATSQAEAAHAA